MASFDQYSLVRKGLVVVVVGWFLGNGVLTALVLNFPFGASSFVSYLPRFMIEVIRGKLGIRVELKHIETNYLLLLAIHVFSVQTQYICIYIYIHTFLIFKFLVQGLYVIQTQ